MFKVPRVNVIESDEGFSVEILGRTGLLYTEGVRSMRIDSEIANATTMAVIKDSIIENIRRAFYFQLKSIEVD